MKFNPYFLVECKNENKDIDKNQFITFANKVENTGGLANLGFMITPKGYKRSTYLESVRDSNKSYKIVFISNREIEQLINSDNLISTLKNIMDTQVKDN